jgi:aerotolerance regulator-like protein
MMSFARPELLLALLLLPLFALLYIRRAGKRETAVPSLMLWQKAAAEAVAETGKRLGAFDLPLLFALLVLACTVLAASGPVLNVGSTQSPKLLLIVDRSASMATRAGGEDRLTWSVKKASALLDELRPERVLLIGLPFAAGPAPRELAWQDARKALQGLETTDLPLDVADAIARCAPLARGTAMTVVLTDDPAPVPQTLAGRPVAVVSNGGPSGNLSIDAVEVTDLVVNGSAVFVSVRNSSPTATAVPIRLTGDIGSKATLTVPANGTATHTFVKAMPGTRAEVVLDVDDGLASDNRATILRSGTPALRVAYVGRGNPFIIRALGLLPGVTVQQFRLTSDVPLGFGLYIYDQVTPEKLPALGDVVLIDPTRSVGPFKVTGARHGADDLRVTATAKSPLLENVDTGALRFKRLIKVTGPATAQALLTSGNATALLRWSNGASRVTVVGCALTPADTNWPMLPSFPIFWSNLIGDVAGEWAAGGPSYRLTGDIVTLRAPAKGKIAVTDPSAAPVELAAAAGARLTFIPNLAGVYTITKSGVTRRLAVNMMHPTESNNTGSLSTPSVADVESQLARTAGSGVPLWRHLGLAALICAFAFWTTATRRGRPQQ